MDTLYVKAGLVGQKADAEGRKIFTYRATTAAQDRQGEVVTVDGWEVENYRKNPVILDAHQYDGIEHILGRSVEIRQTPEGLEADVIYSRVSPKGALAERLVEEGMLGAVSVGFRSLERARGTSAGEPLKHTRKELLEISMVPVPANHEAMRIRAAGGASTETDWDAFLAEVQRRGLTLTAATPAEGGDQGDQAQALTMAEDVVARTTTLASAAGWVMSSNMADFIKTAVIEATKAGRTLSAKNEGLLRQAAEHINTVLDGLGKAPAEGDGASGGDPAKSAGGDPGGGPAAQGGESTPESESDIELKADLSALTAFLGRTEEK